MTEKIHMKKRLSSFQTIILGFAAVILLGAFLLMLPISSQQRIITPFHDALFTSTSAVCVTGLVVRDTASYWSAFGQTILLILIQIGGMGVITIAASFALLSGIKISLMQRSTMQEAIGAPEMGGIVRLTGFIIKMTFIFELAGACILMPVFCKDFGLRGIWMSVFHSISAFCNAGFDLMGTDQLPYASVTAYIGSPLVILTFSLLVIIGGIGFKTWDDVRVNKWHLKQYRMQSKVILITSLILIVLPAVFFFFYEFSGLPIKERLLASFFQSVSPRTAGFNSADLTAFSGAGKCLMIVLMLIGGSPGSTAGGMKTTTIAVLLSTTIAVFRHKEDTSFFGRRIDGSVIRNAATILMMYLTFFLTGACIISIAEGLPLDICLFETASAVGTVGLTLGITPQLGILSQCILIVLMFIGRVGGLTMIYAALTPNPNRNLSRSPQEKITVG